MDNPSAIRIKKIDVSYLIETLKDLYDRGVDYVDLYGIVGTDQDSLGLLFTKEYMDEKYRENFDKMQGDPLPAVIRVSKLSDEDLNQLI